MRKFVLLVIIGLGLSILNAQDDEILFFIEGRPVSVSEFQYIYEKNNRDQADYSKQSVEEYLDLYINFKLKVQKARELGYHQNEAYITELAGYRSQLADSYVINKEVVPRIIDQVYIRQQEDVELNHILISLPRNATKEEALEALDKIRAVKKVIDSGTSFERACAEFSQDRNSASVGGNIGFVNAPLPNGYVELEDAAYQLAVGEISQPVRTDLGYHIIQVVSKRPARGKMEAEHLLIRNSRNGIRLADAYARTKRIYDNILSGEMSFNEATIKYSEDRETKGNGGNLGVFGIGQYESSFEDAAFALVADGDISQPIETAIGYHIIRRVTRKEIPNRKIIRERIKDQPKQGDRFDGMRKNVVNSIKKEAGFKEQQNLLTQFKEDLSSDFFSYGWTPANYQEEALVNIGEDSYDLNDFGAFVKRSAKERMRANGQLTISETVDEIYDLFIVEKAINYAENRLEERYPEFKNLMREYREGIMLFDITKEIVWDKAARDTIAIKNYYNTHRGDYVWKDRAKVTNYSLRTVEPTRVTPVLNASRNASPESLTGQFNTEEELIVYKRETLEIDHPSLQGFTVREGAISPPEFHNRLKVTTFKKIEEIIPARPKTLREARGYVISDYQDQLDKEWVNQLKKEYKVKIQKKILKRLVR